MAACATGPTVTAHDPLTTGDTGAWRNVPRASYLPIDHNGQVHTTLNDMTAGEQHLLAHCMHVALTTIPSHGRLVLRGMVESAGAGALGEGSGLEGDALVQ